ncbi:aminomethyl-transferring glycine dehydrogenase subunit GcvPA [Candidatus Woesearchaeota archaeon]|nr:aminomethyl-transferring glycine dehydrogenase subunit GcvPA [Candidatus Woesearchaeota archaeon]
MRVITLAHSCIRASSDEQAAMLAHLGFSSLDELYDAIVPKEHQHDGKLSFLRSAMTESEVADFVQNLADANARFKPSNMFMGAGFYQRVIPPAVARLASHGNFLTPYTPYQAEAAQGILTTLFDYQSIMAALTGMSVVNAGSYHGPNALAEGVLMACRITQRNKILVSDAVHPTAMRNIETYVRPRNMELVRIPLREGTTSVEEIADRVDDNTAVVVVQNPNFWGLFDGMNGHAEPVHSKGALYLVYGGGDQISLALAKPPGEYGADIYAGEGQHFGIPLGYGGPHVGILGIASMDNKHLRQLPGRLVLKTNDEDGKKGYRLGLQTREQHIRRERATSNACTTQTYISVMNVLYLALVGPRGLEQAAQHSTSNAHYLYHKIARLSGFEPLHPEATFFNEFAVRTPVPAERIVHDLVSQQGILAGVPVARALPYANRDEHVLLISATEANGNKRSLDKLIGGLEQYAATQ